MANYLIEGLSGTGKTTVGEELKRRGHKVIEADAEWADYMDPKTGLLTDEKIQDNWFWDKEKVRKELENVGAEAKFICGGSMNQDEFAEYFTKTFVLHLDDDTLKHRLLTRTNNPFGKRPEELARQIEENAGRVGVIKYAHEKGAIPIDASQPLDKVVDEILEHVNGEKSYK